MPTLPGILIRSIFLDVDNQPVSIGRAHLDMKENRGVFWPLDEARWDVILKNAAKLQTEKSATYQVRNLQLHRTEFPKGKHFDFDIVPAP